MIRDTFESNPGLCELFKRKMLERARFVGLSNELIDFKARIDLKGTYQDNLRTFYREYPQLSQKSDYFRIKSIRSLSGAALEKLWRSYERKNGLEIQELTKLPTERPPTVEATMPELTVTYTVRGESVMARKDVPKEPEPILTKPTPPQTEANPAASAYGELVKAILDRVTAMAGKKVTKTILHQIGQEIGWSAFNCSTDRNPSENLVEALDYVLSTRGWGRVLDIDKTDHGSSETYVCTIKGCSLCYKEVSTNPTCDVMRGIVSRWLETYVQKNAESVESACFADGSEPCVFRVTFGK